MSEMKYQLKPLAETVPEDEFVDREYELELLWNWAQNIKINMGHSLAILGRKGIGKTAILTRFYNRLFLEQEEIVPFYLSLAEYKSAAETGEFTVEKFCQLYVTTFIKQFIAFQTQDARLARQEISIERLKELCTNMGENELMDQLEMLEATYAKKENTFLVPFATGWAKNLTYNRGLKGVVIIDEFQIVDHLYEEEAQRWTSIKDSFQKQADPRWCPMLVSGSAVSLVSKLVFGGLLARRFSRYTLKPLDQKSTIEYVMKLSRKRGIEVSEAVAQAIYERTGGNPYYVWAILSSKSLRGNDLSNLDRFGEILEYELISQDGDILGFWRNHFSEYAEKINKDRIGMRVLFYLAKHRGEEAHRNKIAREIGEADVFKVEGILKNLHEADLVDQETMSIYRGITDPILIEYITRQYRTEIEDVSLEQYRRDWQMEYKKLQGKVNNFIGEVAEVYTKYVMERFDGREVEGERYFGIKGKQVLPRFQSIECRSGVIIQGERIEFDLIGEHEGGRWLVEVKYWKGGIGVGEVEGFIKKLGKMKGAYEGWLFSRGGFDAGARALLEEKGLKHSGIREFNLLARELGLAGLPE
ncbi:MAG: ATP-binding protein [candidate division KSB1 bacterium]|nr:ATP-binding protein [candidate division KSB1 bacterium]